jgi:hypothetical protein
MSLTYYAIITDLGATKLADAAASFTPLVFSHLAVGDGNGSTPTPDPAQTSLVNETARVAINAVDVDPDNPNQVRIEGLIPADTGGFTIREAGVYSDAGDLIAVANYPDIYKPVPADGASIAEYIRIVLAYTNPSDAMSITTDTSVVMATREYVDERVRECFGDGSDGEAVLDGTNTFSWASKSGDTYTLTRDVFLTNLTLSGAAITLKTANFRVFGTGILTTNGGKIVSSGGSSAHSAASAGTLNGGTDGGTPTSGAGGNGGTQSNSGFSGQGGAGGAGSGGAGGSGGTITTRTDISQLRAYSAALLGAFIGNLAGVPTLLICSGGSGGGAGGGNGVSGVFGGAGAGVLAIAFRYVVLNSASDLQAAGTAGLDAVVTNGGGGGGGGGGTLILVRETLSVNDSSTITAANCCPGGAGGAKLGTGVAGSAGSNGSAIDIEIKLLP